MLALSATYPEALAQHLKAYMHNPTFIRLNQTDPALLGTLDSKIKSRIHFGFTFPYVCNNQSIILSWLLYF